MESSILDTLTANLEANKDKIREAREGARGRRTDAALSTLAAVARSHNECLLHILRHLATEGAPEPGARDMEAP
jgi:hypothetical protein